MPKNGCHGEEEWILDHVSDRCPVMFLPRYNALFQAYIWAQRGFLPRGTGWLNESVGLIDGLDIVYRVVDEYEAKQAKAANGGG